MLGTTANFAKRIAIGMKSTISRPVILALLSGFLLTALPFGPANAQWVFVARKVLGRVEQLSQSSKEGKPGYDFASVVLDAPAARVYATAVDLIRKNRNVRITFEDAARRRIDVAEGDRTASLSVTLLSDKISQLMIAGTAGPGEDSTSSRVLAAVLRVCREMRKQCSVGG
jgi:hypothetical protein